MPNTFEFKLPDVGEGLVEAEIVSWKVKPGDAVAVNDVLVEIETAKSLVELPAPYAGTIGGLLVEEGRVAQVGDPIVSIVLEGADGESGGGGVSEKADGPGTGGADEDTPKTLVGYGPRTSAVSRRPRRTAAASDARTAPAPTTTTSRESPVVSAPPDVPEVSQVPAASAVSEQSGAAQVLAKPPVRKLAKDLDVDLTRVPPSGPDGSITRADVEAYAAATAPSAASATVGRPMEPGTRETRVPIRGVRRATAEAVTRSAQTVPHVTEWLTVDVTATVEFLDRLRARPELATVKLSPLLLVAKASMLALRRTPELNARWDGAAGEIVLSHYVNLGVAVATPRGLLVPHIKDAGRLSLPDLASALNELTVTAREARTQPGDMVGTTFTLTNVGVFGVEGGTPILNPGETGILAVGAIVRRPWVVVGADGQETIAPRSVVTLALSFDHRVVDGEQGSRFLTDVAAMLTDPGMGLLYT